MLATPVTPELFKYEFSTEVSMEDVEGVLVLALFGTESLHGESETRLRAEHAMDATKRVLVVDASTVIGQDLNRLFVGFLRREFGDDQFTVKRLKGGPEGMVASAGH